MSGSGRSPGKMMTYRFQKNFAGSPNDGCALDFYSCKTDDSDHADETPAQTLKSESHSRQPTTPSKPVTKMKPYSRH